MYFKESLRIALHCMRAGRLRTILTMLGIVVSVAVVITSSGLNTGLVNSYRDAGDANYAAISITVLSSSPTAGGNLPRSLRDSDIQALTKYVDPAVISDVVPVVNGMVMVRYGDNQYRGNITGASAAYLRIQNSAIRLLAGSVFTSEQYQGKARVILLGPTLLRTLFNGDPNAAIGSTVQIGRQNFEVIGTIGPAGGSMALVPMTTARAYLFGGMRTVGGANVLATSIGAVDAAIDQVNSILDREHFVKNSAQRDFSVSRFDPTGPMVGDLVSLLRWFAAGATGIALFIGALGLANIMLITVTERTSEIGIRRAVGASRGAILRQFLVEAVLIGGFGGLVGVSVGVALTLTARRVLPDIAPAYGIPVLSMEAVALAFGLSLLVGLLAGTYPAIRAARLHPWDALRH